MEIGPLLQTIDGLRNEIDALRPLKPEQEKRILQKFRLDWNYHSNALEGNQVSAGETEIFLQYGLTARGKPFKDYLDIKGHDEAISFLRDLVHRRQPLTEAVVRELHTVLLREPYEVKAVTPDGAPTTKVVKLGEYKTQPNHVKTPTGEIHHYATPEETSAKMGDLMKWFREQSEEKRLHPLVISAIFHHRFVAIHPFDDGNGRMARLLMNLVLMQSGFPPAVIKTDRRDDYLFVLRTADKGDPNEFVAFVAEELIRSEELYLRGARGEPVEELDDLDKEIVLLKQELKHIDDPLEYSAETQKAIFEETVCPLVAKLISKLSQFDELFGQNEIRVNASIKSGNFTTGWPERQPEKADVLETIKGLGSTKGQPGNLDMQFTWNDFKKAPLKQVACETHVIFRFERFRYTLQGTGLNPHAFSYNHALTADEIKDIVATICRPILNAAREAARVP